MQELNEKRWNRLEQSLEKTTINKGKAGEAQVYKYREALNQAHKVGFLGFETEFVIPLCDPANDLYVAHAVARFTDGSSFSGLGDAKPDNVNSNVARHMPRMAETRAKARALGDALNLDANFADEFGGDDPENSISYTARPAARPAATTAKKPAAAKQPDFNAPPFNNADGDGYECDDCGLAITDSEKYTAAKKAMFSLQRHNRIFCYKCGLKH